MEKPNTLLAFPMHGQMKLLSEGYRTRDGHMIEWFGRLTQSEGAVAVASRPEPHLLRPLTREVRRKSVADNTIPFDSYSWRLPNVLDRRKWWVQSRHDYSIPPCAADTPSVIWNPLVGISNIWNELSHRPGKLAVDLLDDWTLHYAFESIWPELEVAYKNLFERAEIVTANAEGTLALAHRFGRDDAILLTNGCDPDRFPTESVAKGPITVGYVGKIGKRVDLDLIIDAATQLPSVKFVFAGPILDSHYAPALSKLSNVVLMGDVHYEDVPQLLQSFDIGWVPHNVGEFEVGGDVIKTYEYRAAHLPVLSTPVAGAGRRDLDSVYVLPADQHIPWIEEAIRGKQRVAREPGLIPERHTWRNKAEFILQEIGFTAGDPRSSTK